ncbi:ABC transporter permease [Paraburkholderia kururiensis]|uniref:ABC transporter permease n=1 Tax=Paraburkholderia kururiensis TaxID=984307 RepID=UPI001F3B568C|nr:ABC transporter permease [Paraburkholderia kururiensis]
MNAGVDGDSGCGVASHGRRLIYFSSVPYASYAQRPHFMVAAFANSGFDSVLWIDPYPTRLPTISDLKRVRPRKAAMVHADDARVRVLRLAALPIEPLPMSGFINHVVAWRIARAQLLEFARAADHCVLAIGRPSKLAEWALKRVPHKRSFVDVLDNFPAFYRGLSRVSMKARLRAVCQNVTDVYCSSSQLASDVSRMRRDAIIVLNGYPTSDLPELPDARPRRYVGYIGTIAEWFDWPLVRSLALALPDVTVRLIGPEFVARPANLPANIEFLGELPHDEVVNMVREFAVGLIPFRVTDLTSGVDPIKFYEYRSMGVPVWSTAFGEMKCRDQTEGVTHVSRESDWPRLWEQARTTAVCPERIASFRAEVDWEKRFEPILMRSRMVSIAPATRLAHDNAVAPPLQSTADRPIPTESMSQISFIKNGAEFKHRAALSNVLLDLFTHRQLLLQLVRRDIAGRYRGSLFGTVWAFFNPLLMLSLYTVVFGIFLHARWSGASNSLQFSVVLFAGLVVFNFFSECLTRAPMLIGGHVNYVKKVAFPLELLPWMTVGTSLFHAGISLVVWTIFSAFVYGTVHWTLIFVPLIFVPLIFMAAGVSWIISSLGVYVRDIGQVIGVLTSVIMFLCPIFYAIESLPKPFQALLLINPLTLIIQQARRVMIDGAMPDFGTLAMYTAASMAFAWLSLAWFQRARDGFADVL